jgi:hypothetical protein
MTWDLRIADSAEPNRLGWHCVGGPLQWIDTDIAFGLGPKPEGGTLVLFDHRGFAEADAMYRIVSYHWAHIFGPARLLRRNRKAGTVRQLLAGHSEGN